MKSTQILFLLLAATEPLSLLEGTVDVLIYVPTGLATTVNVTNLSGNPGLYRWYDPETGVTLLNAGYSCNLPAVTCTYNNPRGLDNFGSRDAILAVDASPLQSATAPSLAASGPQATRRIWSGRTEPNGPWSVFVEVPASSRAVDSAKSQRLSDVTEMMARRPAHGTDAEGRTLVVWASGSGAGGERSLRGRWIDSSGTPAGVVFDVAASPRWDYRQPSVVAPSAETFLVVWEGNHLGTSERRIFLRRIEPATGMMGPEVVLAVNDGAGELGLRVGVSAAGAGIVAWEEDDGTGLGVRLLARRFAAARDEFESPVAIAVPLVERLALVGVTFDSLDRALIVWEEIAYGRSLGQYQAGFDSEGRLLAREQLTAADRHEAEPPSTELP